MRENAFSKARRYLTEGRLLIVFVDEDQIDALCRGDGRVYNLRMRHGIWICDCPAVTDQCSHLRALRLVTVVNRREET